MAKEMCQDCGKVFDGGPKAFFCPECRKRRQSESQRRMKKQPAEQCDFCKLYDWSENSAKVDYGKYAHIHTACGATRYPVHQQFSYCPVCGAPNPNKGEKL